MKGLHRKGGSQADTHSPVIRRAPQVQMAATLPLFFKAGALESTDQLLAIHSRESVAHAAAIACFGLLPVV